MCDPNLLLETMSHGCTACGNILNRATFHRKRCKKHSVCRECYNTTWREHGNKECDLCAKDETTIAKHICDYTNKGKQPRYTEENIFITDNTIKELTGKTDANGNCVKLSRSDSGGSSTPGTPTSPLAGMPITLWSSTGVQNMYRLDLQDTHIARVPYNCMWQGQRPGTIAMAAYLSPTIDIADYHGNLMTTINLTNTGSIIHGLTLNRDVTAIIIASKWRQKKKLIVCDITNVNNNGINWREIAISSEEKEESPLFLFHYSSELFGVLHESGNITLMDKNSYRVNSFVHLKPFTVNPTSIHHTKAYLYGQGYEVSSACAGPGGDIYISSHKYNIILKVNKSGDILSLKNLPEFPDTQYPGYLCELYIDLSPVLWDVLYVTANGDVYKVVKGVWYRVHQNEEGGRVLWGVSGSPNFMCVLTGLGEGGLKLKVFRAIHIPQKF